MSLTPYYFKNKMFSRFSESDEKRGDIYYMSTSFELLAAKCGEILSTNVVRG